jgi:hypothetical protein
VNIILKNGMEFGLSIHMVLWQSNFLEECAGIY